MQSLGSDYAERLAAQVSTADTLTLTLTLTLTGGGDPLRGHLSARGVVRYRHDLARDVRHRGPGWG